MISMRKVTKVSLTLSSLVLVALLSVQVYSLNEIKSKDFTPIGFTGEKWYPQKSMFGWYITEAQKAYGQEAFYISTWQLKGFFAARNTTLLQLNLNRNLKYTQSNIALRKGRHGLYAYMKAIALDQRETRGVWARFQFCSRSFYRRVQLHFQPREYLVGQFTLQQDKRCQLKIGEYSTQGIRYQLLISNLRTSLKNKMLSAH